MTCHLISGRQWGQLKPSVAPVHSNSGWNSLLRCGEGKAQTICLWELRIGVNGWAQNCFLSLSIEAAKTETPFLSSKTNSARRREGKKCPRLISCLSHVRSRPILRNSHHYQQLLIYFLKPKMVCGCQVCINDLCLLGWTLGLQSKLTF